MNNPPLSIQLYSLRDLTKTDFEATVAAVAALGYAGVETAGFGNLDAEGAAAAIERNGLRVSGMHVGISSLRNDLDQVISQALLFRTRHVVCPWWPGALFLSRAACERIGLELDAIGATLRDFGLQLHFHNHAAEFTVLEGRPAFDWILDAAAPRNLLCQADVYWVQKGGKDPAAFIREQGRRITLLHLKDDKELGSGPVDFKSIFSAVEEIGALEWYVVEVESYNHPPLESVRRSFEQMRAWGKA